MASLLARQAVAQWATLINNKERYYYAKAMDIFYAMDLEDQKSLLRFFSEETKNTVWESKVEDNTQYAGVIRSILFYYSGNPDSKQPSKEDFKKLLGKWLRIHEKVKKKVIIKREAKSFEKELEAL